MREVVLVLGHDEVKIDTVDTVGTVDNTSYRSKYPVGLQSSIYPIIHQIPQNILYQTPCDNVFGQKT